MKTNKKLKLNTKKVVILSNEQQDSVQGGGNSVPLCVPETTVCPSNLGTCYSQVPPPPPYSCV